MLILDLWFFAIAGPAVLFAGISKGGFGSGAASASVLALLMLIDVASLKPYWGRWHLREALLIIAGALPGVALGTALYRIASPDLLRLLIGLVSVGFVAWQISIKRGWLKIGARQMPDGAGLIAGIAVGFTSFVSHAGGPPAAVFLLSRGLSKTEYQATSVLIFWAVNIAKFVPYAFLGIFTLETAQANLVLAPFALVGAWLGVRAHRIVPERAFFALTYVLLTVTGVKLIWGGMT